MPRYPAQPLEEKLEWMKERQRRQRAAHDAEVKARRPLTAAKFERSRKLAERPAHLQFYRVDEVAEMLGVSRRSILRWFGDRCVKAGQGQRQIMLISQPTLEGWLRDHTATAQ